MGKVLTFQPRSTSTDKTTEHPAALPDAITKGDLRQSIKALCHRCNHVWWAPTIGACPRCNCTNIAKVAEQALDYKRV